MNPRHLTLALAGVISSCSSGSDHPARDAVADSTAIASAMQAYTADIRTSDASKIASWWTDDAVYIDRKDATIHGRAALDSTLRRILATAKVTDAVVETDDISVGGNLAYFLGRYDETLQPPTGDAVHNRGRFMFIWKRQDDGSWKIARSVGTDLAEPTATTPAAMSDSSKRKGG
jgi:uncharacterized protein (TIGR02246 family)